MIKCLNSGDILYVLVTLLIYREPFLYFLAINFKLSHLKVVNGSLLLPFFCLKTGFYLKGKIMQKER